MTQVIHVCSIYVEILIFNFKFDFHLMYMVVVMAGFYLRSASKIKINNLPKNVNVYVTI